MTHYMHFTFLLAATVLIAGCAAEPGGGRQAADAGLPAPAVKLVFNEKGEAALPKGYRSWVHTYASWEAVTTTILDGTVTKTPEFHSVYVEPNTYRTFMKTGKWPEGSLMIKEFSTTSIDPKMCGGPPAHVCDVLSSKVIFAQGRTGIGVMLKDSKRFPKEPGGWAYFSFGHRAPPYEAFSPARDRKQCAQCHIDNVGPSHDYVWSVQLNQPGFGRDGDEAKHNLEAALGE